MRKFLTLIVALMTPFIAMNAQQDAWNTVYKQIESRIKAPEFKNKTYKAAVKQNNSAKLRLATICSCIPSPIMNHNNF